MHNVEIVCNKITNFIEEMEEGAPNCLRQIARKAHIEDYVDK